MLNLNGIWEDSQKRFTETGRQKLKKLSKIGWLRQVLSMVFSNYFWENLIITVVELLHESVADVDNLR